MAFWQNNMDISRQMSHLLSSKNVFLFFLSFSSIGANAGMKISYEVPNGFNAAEMDDGARYLGSFNAITLPDFISVSPVTGKLIFDKERYLKNEISEADVETLISLFERFDYANCNNGCDVKLDGYSISLDKLKRTVAVRDLSHDYITPETHPGLVHNQSIDLRASSDSYRAMNINGSAWLGLPFQSFGFLSWYADSNQRKNEHTQTQGVSSWYMQKNFTSTYLRVGKQNSVDYSAGSVSTLLMPGFDKFVTVGSQSHLYSQSQTGSLVLYAISEGSFEFYRDGRLILKRPAVLGRNEISFSDLPGGYYSVEIRLVDRNGHVVNRDIQEIDAVNFGMGQNGWSLTAGTEMQRRARMLQMSWSRDMRWFVMNLSAIAGERGKWAAEVNATRPMPIGQSQLIPTLGLLSGERKNGGYGSLALNSGNYGSLTATRYQNNQVSHFYEGASSTTFNYSYILNGMTWSYRYQRFTRSERQQLETRWNYRPNGLWATFALGLQKGGYNSSSGNYGIYLNTTWTLNNSQSNFSAARSGNETQLSGDFRKDFYDSNGQTTAGTTINYVGDRTSVNMYTSRSGTRGDVSLNVGQGSGITNGDFNYRGMFAANSDGIALGRYSYSGAAMLLETPQIEGTRYSFNVEGAPVSGGGRYAVPLNAYKDISYARVLTSSQEMDMNVEVPANILRVHPGQVYTSKASVDINLLYNGFMKKIDGQPIGGVISETGDTVYPNGLFSIASKTALAQVTVDGRQGTFRCDMTKAQGNNYICVPF